MTPPTITVEHPETGESLEVPAPDGIYTEEQVSENYVPAGAHNAEMAKLRRQTSDLVEPTEFQESLLEDEDFRETALSTWEIDPDAPVDDDTPRLTPDRIQGIRDDVRRKEVNPAQEEAEKWKEEAMGLRQKSLQSDILSAASGMVKDSLLKAPVDGQAPPLVNMLSAYFDYDDETGTWAVKEGDGFAYSTEPTDDQPYMGVQEFIQRWADDDANAAFVVDNRQKGPGAKPSSDNDGGRRGGPVRISYEDAQDSRKYRQAQEEAEERGTEVQVIDTPY